jgi:hypothetical protein
MNNEQAMMNMMDWAIGRIAGDPNINKDFRAAVKPEICDDCKIDILAAGQEVKKLGKKTLCEDCYWERHNEAQEIQAEIDGENNRLLRGMSNDQVGRF